jgi:hypothetical protein
MAYPGNVGGNIALPFGGQVIANIDGLAIFEAPTLVGVTPIKVFGGSLGFGVGMPVGYLKVDATLASLAASDEVFTVGDPVATAFLGWHAGNFHWSLGTLVNIPIGDYQEGEIANVALHRWGVDVTAGVTWLHPELGLDLSAAVGISFNGENEATDYDSGNEFHFEAAATKNFTEAFSLGIAGYYNHQLTEDTGAGAVLGPNKGEVAAIGGLAGYNFLVGKHPVSTRIKYFHEFDVTNRLEGDAVFLTLATPLWVAGHEP